MSPKFKGGSDDWLDEDEDSENESRSHEKKKKALKKPPQMTYLSPQEANGVVAEVFPNQCRVRLADGREILSSYRRSGLFGQREDEARERTPVAVGDRVKVELIGSQSGVVEGVTERKNQLARPSPERATRHVIVSNVDLLVIVSASHSPEFSPGLVDRFLIAGAAQGIQTVLCLNKIDLVPEGAARPWEEYARLGYSVIEVSAKKGIGLGELESLIQSKTTVFCGHSGVGKTSLLSLLMGRQVGKVGDVSNSTGKGRHTTTSAMLLKESTWIDTPGVREFGLSDIPPEKLHEYFPEFAQPSKTGCANPHCLHHDEAGCQAEHLFRYPSYRRIFESLRAGEN